MTATTNTFVSRGRAWLLALSLLLAVAALVIASSALAIARRDDVETVAQQRAAAMDVVGLPVFASEDPSTNEVDRAAEPSSTPMPFYGCDRVIGLNRC